ERAASQEAARRTLKRFACARRAFPFPSWLQKAGTFASGTSHKYENQGVDKFCILDLFAYLYDRLTTSTKTYTLRGLGGFTPPCGIGVSSLMEVIFTPREANERIEDSRPAPTPLTMISISFIPIFS